MLHLQLTERDVERLLAGDLPHDRPDLVEVARFLARLRAVGEVEGAPPMSPQLLAELDLAEAGRRPDDGDEVRHRREDAGRRARMARRRWRLVGAAAMVAMLGGIVFAHEHGAFTSQEPSHTTDAPSDADPPFDDRSGPPTTLPATPPPTAPPETEPPPTDPPSSPYGGANDDQIVTSDDGPGVDRRGDGRGDHDGGYDGRDFPGFDEADAEKWLEECGRDWDCWMDAYRETYGPAQPGPDGPP